jgi:hypothetical protein
VSYIHEPCDAFEDWETMRVQFCCVTVAVLPEACCTRGVYILAQMEKQCAEKHHMDRDEIQLYKHQSRGAAKKIV